MSQLEKKLKAQRRKQLKKQEEPSVIQKQFVEAVSGATWRLASDVSSKDSKSAHQKATRLIAFYEKEGYEVTHLSTCIGGTGHDKLVITLIFTKSP